MSTVLTFEEAQGLASGNRIEQQPATRSSITFEEAQQIQNPPQDERGLLQKFVVDPIAGREEQDLPELGSADPADIGGSDITFELAKGFIMEPSERGRMDIIRTILPDATFGSDKFNNTFVDIGGKKFFLNKPGLSPQDALGLMAEVVKFAPGAKIAGALTKGGSALSRFVAHTVAGGATSIISDEVAQELGSMEPTDLGDALVVGLVQGTGETIAAPILGAIAKKILRNKKLNASETQELISAGIEPDSLTKESIASIVQQRGRGTAAERLAVTEGASLPVPVKQTTGDITRQGKQAQFELEAARGTQGETAQNIIVGARQQQQEAIEGNIDALRVKFNPQTEGARDTAAVMAGARVQDKLVNMRNVMGDAVSEAFGSAREARALVPRTAPDIVEARMRRSLNQAEIDVRDISTVQGIFSDIGSLKTNLQREGSKLKVGALIRLRTRINNNVFKAAKDDRERLAARKMTSAIDEVLDEFVTGGLISGDETVVSAFKNAINKSKEFKQIFDGKDVVNNLTRSVGFGEQRVLAVGADDAVNYIFGRASVNKAGLNREIQKLKGVLPKEDFGAVKEAAFLKLLGKGQKQGSFSGKKFSANLSRALSEMPDAMRSIYTKDEIAILSKFARVSERVTTTPRAITNPSGTTAELLAETRRAFGPAGDFAVGVLQKFAGTDAGQRRRAAESAAGLLPQTKAPGGTIGATAAGAERQRQGIKMSNFMQWTIVLGVSFYLSPILFVIVLTGFLGSNI